MNKDYIPLIVASVGILGTLIAGTIGMIGILVGALTNGYLNRKNEQLKWERESSVRHDKDRLALYARFGSEALQMSKALATGNKEAQLTVREKFNHTLQEVRILGLNSVRNQAIKTYNAILRIGKCTSKKEIGEAVAEAYGEQQMLYELIRIELGISKEIDPTVLIWIENMKKQASEAEEESLSQG